MEVELQELEVHLLVVVEVEHLREVPLLVVVGHLPEEHLLEVRLLEVRPLEVRPRGVHLLGEELLLEVVRPQVVHRQLGVHH